MAAPSGLGHLPCACGFLLRRKPLSDWRRLDIRVSPQLIGHLEGDPNQVGSLLAIVGAARVRFDALKERPGLVGAPRDFLEASEQFEALKHGDSTGVEMKPSDGDLVVRCNGFKKGSQARLSEGDGFRRLLQTLTISSRERRRLSTMPACYRRPGPMPRADRRGFIG